MLWLAVLVIGVATAGHQAFSANLYALSIRPREIAATDAAVLLAAANFTLRSAALKGLTSTSSLTGVLQVANAIGAMHAAGCAQLHPCWIAHVATMAG